MILELTLGLLQSRTIRNMESILELVSDLPIRTFSPGDIIMKEGSRKGVLLVLIDGEVEILKGILQINTVDSSGSIFGEVSVLLDRPHIATVKALVDCRFYCIDDPMKFLESQPLVSLHLSKLLARRLDSVTNYLVDLKKQFEEQDDHLGMVDDVLESLLHQQRSGS